ncbi:hypothetical protein E3E26_00815 [Thermococcus sp. LS1]|uniref:hypothetical protein n=1 Tax=Thermococcus sp. LS1 TaxID=1638259 RepID=UPI00143BDCCD|nr:hypothetical protein [Thermococcus sp. LS1]NJD98349.1 hypothetical protein [Thermococcus sp. LS1]
MERWKRNVAGLLLVFALTYILYLVWLYVESGGTMVVSYELPESWFPLFVGVFTFGVAFFGGFLLTAVTREDLISRRSFLPQLLTLSVLFGFLSGVMATAMKSSTSRPFLLAVFLLGVALWITFARRHSKEIQAEEPITDEREELIELRSKALVSDAMITLLAVVLIGDIFGLWELNETPLYFLLATWGFAYLAGQLYYRKVM